MARELSYGGAILEACRQIMRADPRVLLLGQGVNSPWYVGNTTSGLIEEFGPARVFDTPVSENALTGAGIGLALAGMRPVVVHPRMDFALLAVEQIVNQASNWRYMFGGRVNVPLVVRAIINRGGEQAAQHSQALQAIFTHIPGLKVVMPSTPADAKGLMIAAIRDPDPVIYIDDRWLYARAGHVPEELYETPLGSAAVRRAGRDATILATSYMAYLAEQAAASLAGEGIEVEVIDVRTLKPLDEAAIFASVRRTGRLLVADGAWRTGGYAGEIAARVAERCFHTLKAPIRRVTLPDTPAPMSAPLEAAYYPTERDLCAAVKELLAGDSHAL